MSIRHPEFTYDASALLDPTCLLEALSPAWNELTQLNEHNIEAACIGVSKRGTETFVDFHYDSSNVDMQITAGNNWRPVAGSGTRIPDSGEWYSVMDVSYVNSADRLWALGWLQYGVVDPNAFSIAENPADKPRVQFALRVNGVVEMGTITGRLGEPSQPYTGTPKEPNKGSAANDCSTDYRRVQQANAPGYHVGAVLIEHIMEVPAGTATVELVARRVPPSTGPETGGSADSVPVYVFSHKLLCVQIRDAPVRGPDQTNASLTWPSPGDAYNAAGISSPPNGIVAALNDLEAGNILPEGLRYEHLTGVGPVQAALQASQTSGNTTTRVYPGYGSTGSVGAGAWSEVTDSTPTNLRVSGPFNYSTNPAFVLLIGSIQLHTAYDTGGLTIDAEKYGVFGINQHFTSGTDVLLCEAHYNNPSVPPGAASQLQAEVDVPTLAWVDYRTVAPAGPVDFYRMVVTGNGGANITTTWQRGSLQLIQFHP